MKNKPNSSVYISNLSYERDHKTVRDLCVKYGSVKFVKMILDPKTNNSKGMAFVEMGSIEEASKVIEALNGTEIDGRNVKANFAIPQKGEPRKFYLTPTKDAEKSIKPKTFNSTEKTVTKKKNFIKGQRNK